MILSKLHKKTILPCIKKFVRNGLIGESRHPHGIKSISGQLENSKLYDGTTANGETIHSQNEMQSQVDKINEMMNNNNESFQSLK